MKYIVENYLTDEILKIFRTEEEREEWLKDNVEYFEDGGFLCDGTKISIYDVG